VPGGKNFVLFQTAGEQVDGLGGLAGKPAFLNAQGAALLAVLDQPRADDGAVVRFQDGGADLVGALIDLRALVAGGQHQQNGGQDQARDQHPPGGGLLAPDPFEKAQDFCSHGCVYSPLSKADDVREQKKVSAGRRDALAETPAEETAQEIPCACNQATPVSWARLL